MQVGTHPSMWIEGADHMPLTQGSGEDDVPMAIPNSVRNRWQSRGGGTGTPYDVCWSPFREIRCDMNLIPMGGMREGHAKELPDLLMLQEADNDGAKPCHTVLAFLTHVMRSLEL
ncbi:hypothetical protein NDU88_005172 [Pleurodeles waltl]|uniref:Uncharacterized protein n=1 Tax=Pleurodeles waltl TaxID=8319 RepID=A0AAV7MDT7_PLEWA|nr:hypothetical protein NDU88_005172 [Pleurodeles waltl]